MVISSNLTSQIYFSLLILPSYFLNIVRSTLAQLCSVVAFSTYVRTCSTVHCIFLNLFEYYTHNVMYNDYLCKYCSTRNQFGCLSGFQSPGKGGGAGRGGGARQNP
jgi:hypothetical protein